MYDYMNTSNYLYLSTFKIGKKILVYPKDYYLFLKEQYIFDIYRSYLIRKGDTVLDLGANIGAFTVLASKKTGPKGKVIAIEPHKEDFELLKQNLVLNACKNVIPLHVGVGKSETVEIEFWGRRFSCEMKPLGKILEEINLSSAVDFIKMDIEGFEVQTIADSPKVFGGARVISAECHSNKNAVDELLIPNGFVFHPLTTSYILKRLFRAALLYPLQSLSAVFDTYKRNPKVVVKILSHGFARPGETSDEHGIVVGSYVRT